MRAGKGGRASAVAYISRKSRASCCFLDALRLTTSVRLIASPPLFRERPSLAHFRHVPPLAACRRRDQECDAEGGTASQLIRAAPLAPIRGGATRRTPHASLQHPRPTRARPIWQQKLQHTPPANPTLHRVLKRHRIDRAGAACRHRLSEVAPSVASLRATSHPRALDHAAPVALGCGSPLTAPEVRARVVRMLHKSQSCPCSHLPISLPHIRRADAYEGIQHPVPA
jgi:hypothetical protein